jgi:hypothetical protein
MISSNSEGTSENRKLGLSVESKKKQFVAKMIKKIHIQALSAHFIFNQLYKRYLIHNLLQTFNYTAKQIFIFHNVFIQQLLLSSTTNITQVKALLPSFGQLIMIFFLPAQHTT